tara:strand:- start:177 stop:386 length:210 start_codon:yes stop_codon:yes gene_type:complete
MNNKPRAKTKKESSNVFNDNNIQELPSLTFNKSKVVTECIVENIHIEARGYTTQECKKGFRFIKKQMLK